MRIKKIHNSWQDIHQWTEKIIHRAQLRSKRGYIRRSLPAHAPENYELGRSEPMSNRPPPREIQSQLCELAEQIARDNFGIGLDYSIASIQQVESILAAVHNEYVRTQSEDGLQGIALEFAAYIVTVIEKHFGVGDWHRDHATIGPDSFPFQWRGATIFPYGWCFNRIIDGPEDDIWVKFNALVVGNNSKRKGSRPWWRFW